MVFKSKQRLSNVVTKGDTSEKQIEIDPILTFLFSLDVVKTIDSLLLAK